MAAPTEAELNTQLQNTVNLLEESRAFARDNSPNLITMIDVVTQSVEGDFSTDVVSGAEGFRDTFAGAFGNGQTMLEGVIRAYGKFIDEASTDIGTILVSLRKFFSDNARTVEERAFTYGNPVLSGTGDGDLERLNIDENGDNIENQTPDDKFCKCINDANSGTERNSETFEIGGGFGGRDLLDIEGVGAVGEIIATNKNVSLLENSSFDEGPSNGTPATPDDIPSWESLDTSDVAVVVSGTTFEFVTGDTLTYRPIVNDDDVIFGLHLKAANHRLRQKLVNRGIQLDALSSYTAQIAWFRDGATYDGAGTLTLRVGNKSVSVAVVAQTGWSLLKFEGTTNNWFVNFNEDDLSIRIDWVESGGDGIIVDDCDFVPYQVFDGGYYRLFAGEVAFLVDDEFTFADTVLESKIQRWLWILFGEYLPSDAAPTLADP